MSFDCAIAIVINITRVMQYCQDRRRCRRTREKTDHLKAKERRTQAHAAAQETEGEKTSLDFEAPRMKPATSKA